MAAAPARSERRRPRPGSVERPVSARMYRGTWLLVALPLLVAAFSVSRPAPLPAPPLPPAFDRTAAYDLAADLARSYPDRSPGSPGATGAVQWLEQQLHQYGFRTHVDRFEATIPGRGRVRLESAGAAPRSPAAALVETAAVRILEQTGSLPARPSALRQLLDLAFPFSLYEQAPFVGRGIPAITLTSSGDRPTPSFADTPERLDKVRLAQIGGSAQELLGSLDQGVDLAQGTSSYVYLGSRLVRGWAIELVLVASLLPFFAAAVDLFARCRRRRIPLAPALRSYVSRLGFWLLVGAVFLVFGLAGAWPGGTSVPPAPQSSAASHWPVVAILGFLAACGLAWFVARDRLLPRRPIGAGEEVAGYTAALLAIAVVSLLVVATNAFALVLLLPSLHAWLWLPQSRGRSVWVRAGLLVGGFAGPLLLLWSFGSRFGLGFHAPWYLLELTALGYIGLPALVIALAWAAAAAQVAALVSGRYAPYPAPGERPPRGPIRELVRRIVLARRARRRAPAAVPGALPPQ